MIAVIGGGAMGGALLQGLAQTYKPETLAVFEPNAARAAVLVDSLGYSGISQP
ncbi:MAG: NAD(P)-binding domain-containing protein [Synechococcaceae cyanobacterium SM2_3_60]|nr:NAD(P)-binding domain-containing protein [Synechococcaceae cyanobacterium SM2_3_60]